METTAFRMTPDVIRSVVRKRRPGAYVLGDVIGGRFVFRYVGRSDCCIRTRLLTHGLLYRFPYFIFSYTRTAKEAFELECKWWHDCKNSGSGLLNVIHPDSPSGAGLDCPYCRFRRGVRIYLPQQKTDGWSASSVRGGEVS